MNRKRHPKGWVRVAASFVIMGFVVQACSTPDTATLEINGHELSQAEFLYGPNVGPDPDVVFQDDVVVIPNGAQAIRGVSADGLYVLVDPKATGIGDLEVDKVVFLTGRALGRVVHKEPRGKDLLLVLMPIEITELFWEAEFQGELELDAEDMIAYTTAEQPWTVVDAAEEENADPAEGLAPRLIPAAYAPESTGVEDWNPTPVKADWLHTPTAKATGFSVLKPTNYAATGDIGVVFDVTEKGTRVKGSLGLHATRPKVSFSFAVSKGKLEKAQLNIDSTLSVKAAFRITSQNGLGGNFNKQVYLPVSLEVPMYAGNIPFMFRVTQQILVNTAMTAKNSFFQGSGAWKLGGNFSFGYSGGKLQATGPKSGLFTNDPVTSFSGASIGTSMAVLGHSVTFKIGLGMPLLDIGPFVDVISTAGVIRGSDLGILVCNLAYIDLFTKAGVALNVHPAIVKVVNTILGLFTSKKLSSEHRLFQSSLVNLIHAGRVKPAVKLCTPDGNALMP